MISEGKSFLLAAALCAAALCSANSAFAAPQTHQAVKSASADTRFALNWIVESSDNKGLPFVIVDKKHAQIFVFDKTARLLGTAPVLLGLAPGDRGLTNMAGRHPSSLLPAERTTPAGRFVSEPGHNLQGEDLIWIDYNAALAIHRLRPGTSENVRRQHLKSTVMQDRRVSLGCVVVAVAFYDNVIRPTLSKSHGIVYVLPETRSAREVLQAFQIGAD